MLTVLLVVLIIMMLGGLPIFPYSQGWGYGPTGIIGLVLLILLVYLLVGRGLP